MTSESQKSLELYIQHSIALMGKQRYKDAALLIQQVLELDPENTKALSIHRMVEHQLAESEEQVPEENEPSSDENIYVPSSESLELPIENEEEVPISEEDDLEFQISMEEIDIQSMPKNPLFPLAGGENLSLELPSVDDESNSFRHIALNPNLSLILDAVGSSDELPKASKGTPTDFFHLGETPRPEVNPNFSFDDLQLEGDSDEEQEVDMSDDAFQTVRFTSEEELQETFRKSDVKVKISDEFEYISSESLENYPSDTNVSLRASSGAHDETKVSVENLQTFVSPPRNTPNETGPKGGLEKLEQELFGDSAEFYEAVSQDAHSTSLEEPLASLDVGGYTSQTDEPSLSTNDETFQTSRVHRLEETPYPELEAEHFSPSSQHNLEEGYQSQSDEKKVSQFELVERLIQVEDIENAKVELVLMKELYPNEPEIATLELKYKKVLSAQLERKLKSLKVAPHLTKPLAAFQHLNIDNKAGFVLAQIDGRTSIENIIKICGWSKVELLASLKEFHDMKLIDFSK